MELVESDASTFYYQFPENVIFFLEEQQSFEFQLLVNRLRLQKLFEWWICESLWWILQCDRFFPSDEKQSLTTQYFALFSHLCFVSSPTSKH